MNKPSTSMQHTDHSDTTELLPLSPHPSEPGLDHLRRLLSPMHDQPSDKRPNRTAADYRALWKTAIHQQILLLRMEKENQRLEASRDELHIRKVKLNYQEVCQCSQEAQALWEKKLTAPGRTTNPQDKEEIYRALCQGVPKSRRGEVWLFLSHQHRLQHRLPQRQQAPDTPYQDLLKQLTAQQHAILVDLGRTFPTHQYFSAQLGAGQLSLYNLLKAYSLLDTEVGYCQGVSFVAGILLLHMSEEQAFDTLKFLMYDLGIRRQYRPDMVSLQIQMYQLSRLLHDYHRDLYTHFEEHEICPSLYAAPWFLTLFASQFPLGFVSRIFDFVLVQGTEVIFKVALCLLSSHEGEIVECDGFESIVDYLKTTLPTLTQAQMEQTIAKVHLLQVNRYLLAHDLHFHTQTEPVDLSINKPRPLSSSAATTKTLLSSSSSSSPHRSAFSPSSLSSSSSSSSPSVITSASSVLTPGPLVAPGSGVRGQPYLHILQSVPPPPSSPLSLQGAGKLASHVHRIPV
ncbi:transcript variant X9, partial [Nothobranchius furzeri]